MSKTPLQQLVAALALKAGVSAEFIEATDHSLTCRCQLCLGWWSQMGADPETGKFGAFSEQEIIEFRKERNGA